MSDQLSIFEPTGQELVVLCTAYLRKANGAASIVSMLHARGMTAVASSLALKARQDLEHAEVCESAIQFERLAGLVA